MDNVTNLDLQRILDDPAGVDDNTVLAIAKELQGFRNSAEPGTPPDAQDWGHAYDDDSVNLNTAMRTRGTLEAQGCTWFRVHKRDDIIFIDGWLKRPEKMAEFFNYTHYPVDGVRRDQP